MCIRDSPCATLSAAACIHARNNTVYEGYLLSFYKGNERKNIFWYKNIRLWDLHTFACVRTKSWNIFSTLMLVPQKCGFGRIQQLLEVMKIVVHAFFVWHSGTKRSHLAINQVNTGNETLTRCFPPSNNQLFDVLCESWHCRDEEWCDVFGLSLILI